MAATAPAASATAAATAPLTLAALAGASGAGAGAAEAGARADTVRRQLEAAGLEASDAEDKAAMFSRAAARLLGEGVPGSRAAPAFWVPGRVEIAGKHTDYAGGRSLLAATTRGFAVVSTDRDDGTCRIFTSFGHSRRKESVSLSISPDLEPQQGHWSNYPATAIRRLARNFGIDRGADIALECDLPESSGMSTSSAVICYMWLVLARRNGIPETDVFKRNLGTPEALCTYLGFIENGQDCGPELVGDKGVGTFGGSEDHTAIMSCTPGSVALYSYCPTKHEGTFDFPKDWAFVIAVSGALAEKTGGAMADYNNAAFLARDAAAAWCRAAGERPLGGATFVPARPNLAEIVRHVRAGAGGTGGAGGVGGESAKKGADDLSAGVGGADGDGVRGSDADARVKAAVAEALEKEDDGERWGPGGAARYRRGALRERFEQFFDESEILTPAIAKALASADAEALGRWSDESHRQMTEGLRNTVPETAWLPQEARRQGAFGASAFGAGFGGSCWAVVRKRGAEAFADRWAEAYRSKFPRCAGASSFFVMSPGPGACSLG